MNRLIFPDIFNSSVNPVGITRSIEPGPQSGNFPNLSTPWQAMGHSHGVKAFFTKKTIGVNIEEICHALSIQRDNVYLPMQRHTDKVQVVKTDLIPKIADAVLTRRKGILIGVKVADCVPVLFSDMKKSVVGAVHAGWRGTAAQIVKKAIALMIKDFGSSPEDIKLALGPSIRWSCYHVGHEVKDAIYEATGEGEYYLQRDGKYCIDLASANRYQAISMGVPEENIWVSHECTYCNSKEYYSYRYTKTLNGSQGGFIGIF